MAIKQITSSGSPYNLTVNDFSPLLNIPYCLLIASGGGAITVNLPTVNSLNKFGKVLVVCADGITSVTLNADVSDAITESGSISMSKTVTGNKNFLELEAATYVSGNIWLGSTNGGSGGGGGGGVTSITYSDLMTLAGANNLTQGAYYLITDFQTVTYIQFSGGGIGSEDINVGAIEPMLVQAATSNSFAANIISTIFSTDEITWKATFADRDWDAVAGQSTGVITSRYDTINRLYRDFDWRNVVFRRWETVNGSGIYDSYLPTAFAFQDYPPFPVGAAFNVNIGSVTVGAAIYGLPYQLDNVVGKVGMYSIAFNTGALCNFEGAFESNFGAAFIGNSIASDFAFNNVDVLSNNAVNKIIFNRGQLIANNSGNLIIDSNKFNGGIQGNSFDGTINNNTCGRVFGNVSSLLGCSISANVSGSIAANTDFKLIVGNNTASIKDNVGNGVLDFNITDNVGHNITNNLNLTRISDNNVNAIVNNIGNGTDFYEIRNNSGDVIQNNSASNALQILKNSVGGILNNVFEDLSLFEANIGNNFNDNQFNGVAGKSFNRNVFGEISQCGINNLGVNKNTFLANLGMKVFTPTVSMDSNLPSVTIYDATALDVEQVLNAGVLSYTPF
jgi:hypothetical protein